MSTAAAVKCGTAGEADAAAITALRLAANADLTARYGRGHWSGGLTERGVRAGMRSGRVLVARRRGRIVGTLRLCTKKPWAIDVRYFAKSQRPIYLVDMAVAPGVQRQGVGRTLLEHAAEIARERPGDAIRLDAYAAPAGAGGFYASCGYAEVGRASYRSVPLVYYELLLRPR